MRCLLSMLCSGVIETLRIKRCKYLQLHMDASWMHLFQAFGQQHGSVTHMVQTIQNQINPLQNSMCDATNQPTNKHLVSNIEVSPTWSRSQRHHTKHPQRDQKSEHKKLCSKMGQDPPLGGSLLLETSPIFANFWESLGIASTSTSMRCLLGQSRF